MCTDQPPIPLNPLPFTSVCSTPPQPPFLFATGRLRSISNPTVMGSPGTPSDLAFRSPPYPFARPAIDGSSHRTPTDQRTPNQKNQDRTFVSDWNTAMGHKLTSTGNVSADELDPLYPIPIRVKYRFVNGSSQATHYSSLWNLQKPFARLLARITGERFKTQIGSTIGKENLNGNSGLNVQSNVQSVVSPSKSSDQSPQTPLTHRTERSHSKSSNPANMLRIVLRTSLPCNQHAKQYSGTLKFVMVSHSQSAVQKTADHFRSSKNCEEISRLFEDSFRLYYEYVDSLFDAFTREIQVLIGPEKSNHLTGCKAIKASEFRVLEQVLPDSNDDSGDKSMDKSVDTSGASHPLSHSMHSTDDSAISGGSHKLLTPLKLPTSTLAMASEESPAIPPPMSPITPMPKRFRTPRQVLKSDAGLENFSLPTSSLFLTNDRGTSEVSESSEIGFTDGATTVTIHHQRHRIQSILSIPGDQPPGDSGDCSGNLHHSPRPQRISQAEDDRNTNKPRAGIGSLGFADGLQQQVHSAVDLGDSQEQVHSVRLPRLPQVSPSGNDRNPPNPPNPANTGNRNKTREMSDPNGQDPNHYITYLFAACCLCGILCASTVSLIVVICCCTPKRRGYRNDTESGTQLASRPQIFHKVPTGINTEHPSAPTNTMNQSGEISVGSTGTSNVFQGINSRINNGLNTMNPNTSATGTNTGTTTQGLMQQLQSIQLLLQQQLVNEANAQQQGHCQTSVGCSFNGDSYQNSIANINLSRAASVGAVHDVIPNIPRMIRRGSDASQSMQSMQSLQSLGNIQSNIPSNISSNISNINMTSHNPSIPQRPMRVPSDSPYNNQPIQHHVVLNPYQQNPCSQSIVSSHDKAQRSDIMLSAPGSTQMSHAPIRVNSSQFMEFLEFERRKASQQSHQSQHSQHSHHSHHSQHSFQGQDQGQYGQQSRDQRNQKRKRSQSADQCMLSLSGFYLFCYQILLFVFLWFYSLNLDDDLRVELDMDQSYIVDVLQSGSGRSGSSEKMFNEISPRKTSNGMQTVTGDGQTEERDGEVSNPTSARDTTAQTKVFATAFVNTTQ